MMVVNGGKFIVSEEVQEALMGGLEYHTTFQVLNLKQDCPCGCRPYL